MKKSLMALAVIGVMPVLAQADVTLSGSISASYNAQHVVERKLPEKVVEPTVDKEGVESTQGEYSRIIGEAEVLYSKDLNISVSEVLANGMLATAQFSVTEQDNSASVGLLGEFGALEMAEIGIDSTYLEADIAGVVEKSEDLEDAITYKGKIGNIELGFSQLTESDDSNSQFFSKTTFDNVELGMGFINSRTFFNKVLGMSYHIEGLKLSLGKEFIDLKDSDIQKDSKTKYILSAKYVKDFGDILVSANYSSAKYRDDNINATYKMGDLYLTASVVHKKSYIAEQDANSSMSSSEWKKLWSDEEKNHFVDSEMEYVLSALYKSGDITVSLDSNSNISLDLAIGDNANLILARISGQEGTSLKETGLEVKDEGYKLDLPAFTKLTYRVSF
jgi:hypothetical protein